MATRLVEVFVPAQAAGKLLGDLADVAHMGAWSSEVSGGARVSVLIDADHTTELLDILQDRFGATDDFRVAVLRVEVTLPRPAEPEDDATEEPKKSAPRVAVEEIVEDILETVAKPRVFAAMVVLSTVVAAIGLYRDHVAVVIGAMVIAPLLGPNIALALATTIADVKLAKRAGLMAAGGALMALAISMGFGFAFPASPSQAQLGLRTAVTLSDIALALAAGAAGALAFTTGVPAALVGVMVAVALLPPLVTVGVFAGSQEWAAAYSASLLLATNVVSLYLAAMVTFRLRGVAPRAWWEAGRARRASIRALVLGGLLLAVLGALIWLTGVL